MSDKFSLDMRGSPAPNGAKGGVPYASSATDIAWAPHATGTQFLRQTGDGIPVWVTSGPGASTSVWAGINQTANRVSGTVYQNTASYAMLVMVTAVSSGTGNCEGFSDASNPPTTSRSKTSNQSGYGLSVVFWVMPNHYYKATATTAAIAQWTEWTLTKGTMTDSGDLSGSRAYTTVYHNTSGKLMFVGIEVGNSGSVTALTDSSNPPTTTTAKFAINSGVGITLFFPVLDGDYYEVTVTGAPTIVKWYEWTLDTVVVTRSASLAARALQTIATPTKAYLNISGKSVFVAYSGHAITSGTVRAYLEPTLGFSSSNLPTTIVNQYSATGSTTAYKSIVLAMNPYESYGITFDAGIIINDAYWEWTLE